MFELTIKDTVYQFRFGMGFVREINKKVVAKIDSNSNATKNQGLQYAVAGIMDGDVEALVDVLDLANKTEKPRVTRPMLDAYIEDESTDIESLFKDVLDFLEAANATKNTVLQLKQMIEEQKSQKK